MRKTIFFIILSIIILLLSGCSNYKVEFGPKGDFVFVKNENYKGAVMTYSFEKSSYWEFLKIDAYISNAIVSDDKKIIAVEIPNGPKREYMDPKGPTILIIDMETGKVLKKINRAILMSISPQNDIILSYFLEERFSRPYLFNLQSGKISAFGSEDILKMAWNKDGTKIAFSNIEGLFIKNLKTNEVKKIFQIKNGLIQTPCWTPDGNKIIFSYFAQDGSKLCSISPNGDNFEVLIEKLSITDAKVSEDGNIILYCTFNGFFWELRQINMDGTGDKKLLNLYYGTLPSWL